MLQLPQNLLMLIMEDFIRTHLLNNCIEIIADKYYLIQLMLF